MVLDKLPQLSLREVALHNSTDDIWICIHNKIYDMTNFQHTHPGGPALLRQYGGTDATAQFDEVGHSRDSLLSLEDIVVGELIPEDRVHRPYIETGFYVPKDRRRSKGTPRAEPSETYKGILPQSVIKRGISDIFGLVLCGTVMLVCLAILCWLQIYKKPML